MPDHEHEEHDAHHHDALEIEETEVEKNDEHDHTHEYSGIFGSKTGLIFGILAGVFLLVSWLLDHFSDVSQKVIVGLYLVSFVFGGYYALIDTIKSLGKGRFQIDLLMLVAAAGAASLGEWFEGALLLFLFSIGHALEAHALGRAKREIEALAGLAPKTAMVRREQEEIEIPIEELRIGDVVIVRTNERIAADGFVVEGQSNVNQAPVTGESIPVDKSPVDDRQNALEKWDSLDQEHRVFAGTINGNHALEISVVKLSSESTLARVVELVSSANTEKSPTQNFASKFEKIFVPVVLSIVVLLLFAWLVINEPFSSSFYRAMAVLVAASPCALAISTPSAVLSGVARAGKGGVLVKGGGPLENLGSLNAIAFDKTGTLTRGKPQVTDLFTLDDSSEVEILEAAVAVEKLSDHPLAKAVLRYAEKTLDGKHVSDAEELESITGRGLRGIVLGEEVYLGKAQLFEEIEGPLMPKILKDKVQEFERNGRTTMVVRKAGRYLGTIGMMDTPRSSASATISKLRKLGIERMIMISGDNQSVADSVAREVGLDEARGNLMPDDKVREIIALRDEGLVAMVGDGVNDAPAMANATVGIAMGAAGSDVALETADVALMADDLSHLPFAVGLSRKTRRIIKQNLWISLGMVAFLVPATILGLRIGPAVILHEGSTLVVVFNALRLLGYKRH